MSILTKGDSMKMKHLEVTPNTHKKIKSQALIRDMSIKEYVDFLADQDKKQLMKGK